MSTPGMELEIYDLWFLNNALKREKNYVILEASPSILWGICDLKIYIHSKIMPYILSG